MKVTPRLIRNVNLVLAGGISTAYVIGKTLYLEKRKGNMELKINGKPAPVPPKIQSLINEVLVDMKIDEEDKKKITPFITRSPDVKHLEKTILGKEIYLGIPEHFLFDKNNFHEIIVEVEGKLLETNSKEFESLKRAFSLSDEAKKFAIAHQIYMSYNYEIVPYSILPTLVTLCCCLVSFLYEKTRKKFSKPPSIHFHIITFLTSPWLYCLLHDLLCIYEEGDSDHQAAELGDSYVKGGIEYYWKMLERNKVLKKLNEKSPYSESGDIITSRIRTDHMSLFRRLKYLNEINNGKKSSVWEHVMYS